MGLAWPQGPLAAVEGQMFCPYKGLCGYYGIGEARRAAWSCEDAWTEVRRISGMVSYEPDKVFEPDKVEVHRDLTTDELAPGRQA